jgi:hypothetical protein
MTPIPDTMKMALYNSGVLFSYALAIGSIALGSIQAGLIFLFCIVTITILSGYFLTGSIKPIHDIPFDTDLGVNLSLCSFTLLYIASSRIYNNEITSQYLGVVITSGILVLLYAIVIGFIKKLPYTKIYVFVFIISSILGGSAGFIMGGLDPQFILIGNNSNSDSTNTQCSTTPGNTFKCSFISSEDGTEIDLDDILNK